MRFPWMLALTGTLQGLLLWALWHADKHKQWPATQPMLQAALLYAALAVPLVIYFTQNVEHLSARVRRIAIGVYALAFAALGAYALWASGAVNVRLDARPADALAAFMLGFVSLSLLNGFDFETRRWRYAWLFNYSWRNGLLLVTAAAMTGVLWMVLFAGAGLMQLIGMKWVMRLIEEPLFAFPVSGFAVAAAMALGLARTTMIESIRRFWLSISSWLLPLVLFFGVLWVLSIVFTGVGKLFETRSAALMMLWFAALAVQFTNCAYQDGEAQWPYPRWLSWGTQAAWLSMLAVVGLAWWALGLRVAQHGWSEQRLWAALAALLAAVYAVGYALSWLRRTRWMQAMAGANIVAAIVLCLGLLAFISPLANVQRIAVAAHMQRVQQAGGKTEPDWRYLRWDAGRFGREALQALAAGEGVPPGQGWAQQAAKTLAQTNRYAQTDDGRSTTVPEAEVKQAFAVYPKGRELPPGFVSLAQRGDDEWQIKECLDAKEGSCSVWLGDLNGDGQEEVLLLGPEKTWTGVLYQRTGKQWRRTGSVAAIDVKGEFDSTQLKTAKSAKSEWADLLLQGQRWRVRLGTDEGGE